MKRFVSFLILILMIFTHFVFAAEDVGFEPLSSTTFEISAFKIGPEDYLKLYITDAINESLAVIDYSTETDLDTINLSDHTDALIDTPTVIFSYRVAGNTTGSYTVRIDFNPLKIDSADQSKQDTITATYGMNNFNLVFPVSYTTYVPETDWEIYYQGSTNADGLPVIASREVSTSPVYDAFSVSWKVDGSGDAQEWVSRGAVTMQLDENTYKGASTGTYKANVVVTLEENS